MFFWHNEDICVCERKKAKAKTPETPHPRSDRRGPAEPTGAASAPTRGPAGGAGGFKRGVRKYEYSPSLSLRRHPLCLWGHCGVVAFLSRSDVTRMFIFPKRFHVTPTRNHNPSQLGCITPGSGHGQGVQSGCKRGLGRERQAHVFAHVEQSAHAVPPTACADCLAEMWQ